MNSAVQPRHSGTNERAHLASAGQLKSAARPPAEKPVRLLIVSDETPRLRTWRKALLGQPCEITEQANPLNASPFLQRNYDLVVVDVAATQLSQVLATIRATERQIPVLVDASRLPTDLSCAGVLPQFRAMACTRHDLLRLVNQQCKPADGLVPVRRLL
jgi:CheY-like chemotaxis protein